MSNVNQVLTALQHFVLLLHSFDLPAKYLLFLKQ
jgi:hypothetical protein